MLQAGTGTLFTFLGCKQKPAHALEKTDLARTAADLANFSLPFLCHGWYCTRKLFIPKYDAFVKKLKQI
jgi:hypothetical protein